MALIGSLPSVIFFTHIGVQAAHRCPDPTTTPEKSCPTSGANTTALRYRSGIRRGRS